ncbi:MAG: FAD-dependent oxidoreductase [Parcubacteria group bacterium]|nr:FAD-dependent oxidoreductase [Parcubacteria group bacterium]
MRYLIIGGGVAGTTAAGELRRLDSSAEITIVCDEHHPLYSRVLLPLYLNGKVERERIFLKKESWYADQEIEWLRGDVAVRLNVKNKFVELLSGREIEYDKLLLTTGSEVRVIDADMRGVSYFRTLDDADHMSQLFLEQGEDAHGGIYGGGFIACEYLNLFGHFNIPIVLAHRGEHFWNGTLESSSGELMAKHLTEQGVELYSNADFKDLVGDKELTGFTTNAGDHKATLLGVGIGVGPDLSWLKDSGVETGAGIKADEYLETNVPGIFTAGDVAEFYHPILGRQLKLGNWMNSMSQGRAVAKNMVGDKAPFDLVSSYAMNVLGLDLIFVGDVEKAHSDQIHVIGSVEDGGITQVHERDGKVVGGVCLNRNTDRPTITTGIKEKASASDIVNTLSG